MDLYRELPMSAQTLYAELLEQAIALAVSRPYSSSGGSFVSKTVRGRDYVYFQYREAGQRQRQVFLGLDDPQTRTLVKQIKENQRSINEQEKDLGRLASAFVASGGYGLDHPAFRVIKAFADAGILRPGQHQATLVGTYAFNLLANVLGVQWISNMKTQDVDVAADALVLAVNAIPEEPAPEALEQLNMGFLPVPQLDPRHPSTSFKVRGKDLRVDLLTSGTGNRPVKVPLFGSVAQPLEYMDFLLADTIPVVASDRKNAVMANVPEPVRFAFHKLLVAESRPVAFRAKSNKDRQQADALLSVCVDQSPYQVEKLLETLKAEHPAWFKRVERSLRSLSCWVSVGELLQDNP